jgi:Holliday junction DNA helicase RuvA
MIAKLKGVIDEKLPSALILDVSGVGYELHVSDLCWKRSALGPEMKTFYVYTHVREDQLSLYGFESILDKDTFEILLSASGVGPKVALGVLSALEGIQILEALDAGNKNPFSGISGVGKKTVEKIFVELREKAAKRLLQERGHAAEGRKLRAVPNANASTCAWTNDLEQALGSLGYRETEVRWMVNEVLAHQPGVENFDGALRLALQFYSKNVSPSTKRGNA